MLTYLNYVKVYILENISKERRAYLGYAGSAIVGVIIGRVILPGGSADAVTQTVTQTQAVEGEAQTLTKTKTVEGSAKTVVETAVETKTVGAGETATITERATVTEKETAVSTVDRTVTNLQTVTKEASAAGATSPRPGHLIMQYPGFISSLDPAGAGGWTFGAETLMNCYDGLFHYQQGLTPQPKLVTSWERSEDTKTWTFKLRNDVKFHSGNQLTAHDVVWSLKRGLKVKHPSWTAIFQTIGSDASIEALDDYTLQIKVTGAGLAVHYGLANPTVGSVLDSKVIQPKIDAELPEGEGPGVTVQWLSRNTAGSGPFKVGNVQEGVQWSLERWDDYWRGPAKLEKFTFKIIEEPVTAVNLLKSGEIDYIWRLMPDLIEDLKGEPGIFTHNPGPTAAHIYFAIDHSRELMKSKTLRQAMAYGVPYSEIVNDVMRGYGVKSTGWSIPGQVGWFPGEEFPYKYDPDKARALVQETGLSTPIDLGVCSWASFLPVWEQMSAVVKARWEAIGITMQPQVMDDAVRYGGFFDHKYNINWTSSLWNIASPYTNLPPHFTQKGIDDGVSLFQFAHPTSDAAFAIAGDTTDLALRNVEITKAMRVLADEVSGVMVYWQVFPLVLRDWIEFDYINYQAPVPLWNMLWDFGFRTK